MAGVRYICKVYEPTLKAMLQLYWILELKCAVALKIHGFVNNEKRELIVYQDALVFWTVPSGVEILADQIQAYKPVWGPTKHGAMRKWSQRWCEVLWTVFMLRLCLCTVHTLCSNVHCKTLQTPLSPYLFQFQDTGYLWHTGGSDYKYICCLKSTGVVHS